MHGPINIRFTIFFLQTFSSQ